jgi:hypothetical protein
MSPLPEFKLTLDIEFSNNIFVFYYVVGLVSSHC